MTNLGYTRNSGCPTYPFSVAIVRNKEGKYLAVNETRNRGWWVPAGFVDAGETFMDGALRETKEEAGIDIELKGIQLYFVYCFMNQNTFLMYI